MTKQTKWLCAQGRLRSAWASTQSAQSLRCALNGWLRTQAFFMRTAKTLIRLGGCPGWSESSLGAQSFAWFYYSRLILYIGLFCLRKQVRFFKKLILRSEVLPNDIWKWNYPSDLSRERLPGGYMLSGLFSVLNTYIAMNVSATKSADPSTCIFRVFKCFDCLYNSI